MNKSTRKCPLCKELSSDLTAHYATTHRNPNARFVMAHRAMTAAGNGEHGPRFAAWLKANGR